MLRKGKVRLSTSKDKSLSQDFTSYETSRFFNDFSDLNGKPWHFVLMHKQYFMSKVVDRKIREYESMTNDLA